MHDCHKIEETLVDLVFDDLDATRRSRALAEVESCAHCREQVRSLRATLSSFDEAAGLMMPDESYWSGYGARLRSRLTDQLSDDRPDFWQRLTHSLRPRPVSWAVSFAALLVMALLLWSWLRQPSPAVPNQLPQEAVAPTPKNPLPEPRENQEKPKIVKQKPAQPSTAPAIHRSKMDRQLAAQAVKRGMTNSEPAERGLAVAVANAIPAAAIAAIVDEETLRHFEKSQNFLRSFRNLNAAETDSAAASAAIADERRRARSLLFQNILLRREAEMKGNLPVEQMLNDLEPVLLDIANLADRATPAELRAVRERIQKKEMIAALQVYAARVTLVPPITD